MPFDVIDLRPNRSTYTCQFRTQTAHGFNVGEQVYLQANGDYALAQADQQATLRVSTVAEVISVDRFVVAFEGRMPWNAHGLTVGAAYYLSGDTPGAITQGPPTNTTYFKQPVLVPINANEVRLIEFIVPDGTTTTGGGLFQQVDNLPAGSNWHRLGRLGGFCVTELLIQGFAQGVGTSSISVTVGSNTVATADNASNLRLNSRSGDSVFQNVRLNVDGGITYVEVLTVTSVNPYSIAVTVVSDSSPRAGTGWQFDPAFQISPGGSQVASFPAFISNVSPTNPGMQWAIADGNTGDGFWLQNRQFRMANPLSMENQVIRNVGAPSNPNDAVRLIDLDGTSKLRGTLQLADGATLSTAHQNWVAWSVPAAWLNQPVEITWNLELFRGSGSGQTYGWCWFNGGSAGDTFTAFVGYQVPAPGSNVRHSWTGSYVINSLNNTNITMAVRLDALAWQFGNADAANNQPSRRSNAFARLVV